MEHTCIEGGDGPVEDPCLACGGRWAVDERIRLDEAMMVLREHCLSLVRARKTVFFFAEDDTPIRVEPDRDDDTKWVYWRHGHNITERSVDLAYVLEAIDKAAAFPINEGK
jgi:hypothetical protein